jgi:preprotein translocase SecE subunit
MSAENTVEEKSRRRRNRQEEAEIEEEELEESTDTGLTPKKGRATPSRRYQEEEVVTGNFVVRLFQGAREYLQGVRDEMTKVVWPTREEMFRLTRIVLVVVILCAIALGIIAVLFSELFVQGLEQPVIFLVVFAVVAGAYMAYTRAMARRDNMTPY